MWRYKDIRYTKLSKFWLAKENIEKQYASKTGSPSRRLDVSAPWWLLSQAQIAVHSWNLFEPFWSRSFQSPLSVSSAHLPLSRSTWLPSPGQPLSPASTLADLEGIWHWLCCDYLPQVDWELGRTQEIFQNNSTGDKGLGFTAYFSSVQLCLASPIPCACRVLTRLDDF